MEEDNNLNNHACMASTSTSPKAAPAGKRQTNVGKFGKRGNPGSVSSIEHGHTEQDIMLLVRDEQEQTIDEMLDAEEEKEVDVLQEIPLEKESSTKPLSDVLTSPVTITKSLGVMSFQHYKETISLLKRATTLVDDKYISKTKSRE